MPITRLLLILEVWDSKPTYRKSWAGNLLVWSDLTFGPSFKVKRVQPNLKVLITRLLLVLEVWNSKPAYRKSESSGVVTRFRPRGLPLLHRSNEDSHIENHAYNWESIWWS